MTDTKGYSEDETGQQMPFLRECPEAKSYYRDMMLHFLSQKGGMRQERSKKQKDQGMKTKRGLRRVWWYLGWGEVRNKQQNEARTPSSMGWDKARM